MKWDKQAAAVAIKEFYESIELTEWAETHSSASERSLRTVECRQGRVYAFVDPAKLKQAVDAVLLHHFVSSNFVAKTLEDRIADNCIVQFVDGGVEFDVFVEELIASFVRAIRKPVNVYMAVYGAVITERLTIGQYEFIPGDQFDTLEIRGISESLRENVRKQLWDDRPHVCVTVEACDGAKAKELAYPMFRWLENAVRLFLDERAYNFGITTFDFSWGEHSLAISQDGTFASFNSQLRGCVTAFDMAEKLNKTPALRVVIENLGRKECELTEIRQRMHRAVYLAGSSKKEYDSSVAYLLCIMAMEALFVSPGNPYMSPSIAQQIAEAFCLLVATDQHRRLLFDEFQDVYKKRSAVAHGADKYVAEDELLGVQHVLRDAITKLLIDPALSKITELKQAQDMIKDIKFGKRQGGGA